MKKTIVLTDLFREFGDKAQDALNFIANETNRRKLAWLENEQTCQGNGRIDFNVNVTETANVSEPQFFIIAVR